MGRTKTIKTTAKFVSVLILLIIVAVALYGITSKGPMGEDASVFINKYGTPGLFIISILLDLIPQLISPIIALGVALLAGINIYLAISATILGSLIGSSIGFAIGKKYMFDAVDTLTKRKTTNRLTYLTNKYGKIVVPVAAISPLPYLPIALGAINFSRKNFILFGLIPRAISIAAYGFLFSLL